MSNRRVDHLARLVAVNERAADSGPETLTEADASLPAKAVPQTPQDIIGRMDVSLDAPEGVDKQDWARARELFLTHAGSALDKLSRNDRALDGAEGGLPQPCEEIRDRTVLGDDHRIRVRERKAEVPRDPASDRGLAGPHRPDERDRAGGHGTGAAVRRPAGSAAR